MRSLLSQTKPHRYRRTNESHGGKGPLRKEVEKQGGKCPVGRAQGGDGRALNDNEGRDAETEREVLALSLLITNYMT